MSSLSGVSVVVCCFNSSNRLGATLNHLAEQSLEGIAAEIIVVDNCSTDGTAGEALRLWTQLNEPYPLRVVLEPDPGLMNARRKGVSEAKYDVLVFCDDDNWLAADYLATAYQYFADHPAVGAVGGRGEVRSVEIPYWFRTFSRQYACFPQIGSKVLYGAGLSVRTRILKHIFSNTSKFFLSGRIGGRLLGGDDHELGYMIRWTGMEVHYLSKLEFGHFMPQQRLSLHYLKKLMRGAGYSAPFLWPYESSSGWYIYIPQKVFRLFMGFPKICLNELFAPRLLALRLFMHGVYVFEAIKSIMFNMKSVREIERRNRATKARYRIN